MGWCPVGHWMPRSKQLLGQLHRALRAASAIYCKGDRFQVPSLSHQLLPESTGKKRCLRFMCRGPMWDASGESAELIWPHLKPAAFAGLLKRSPFCNHLKHVLLQHQNKVGNHHLQVAMFDRCFSFIRIPASVSTNSCARSGCSWAASPPTGISTLRPEASRPGSLCNECCLVSTAIGLDL